MRSDEIVEGVSSTVLKDNTFVRSMVRYCSCFLILLTVLIGHTIKSEADNLRDFGDFARLGSPLSAAILTVLMRDPEGLAQLSAGYATGRIATYGIKRLTKKKRPNFQPGGPRLAFPSGHVEETWQAASFVR